jgi:hypothetical protein
MLSTASSNFTRSLGFPKLMITDDNKHLDNQSSSSSTGFPQLHAAQEILTPPSPHRKAHYPAAVSSLDNQKQELYNLTESGRRQTPLLHQGEYFHHSHEQVNRNKTPSSSSSISTTVDSYSTPTTLSPSYTLSSHNGIVNSGAGTLTPSTTPTPSNCLSPSSLTQTNSNSTVEPCAPNNSEPHSFYHSNMNTYAQPGHSPVQRHPQQPHQHQHQTHPALPHLNFERSPHLPQLQEHDLYSQDTAGLMTPPVRSIFQGRTHRISPLTKVSNIRPLLHPDIRPTGAHQVIPHPFLIFWGISTESYLSRPLTKSFPSLLPIFLHTLRP